MVVSPISFLWNKVFFKVHVWVPCFSISTRENCFSSLNATSHKSTSTRTVHSCMYHSALIDLRMQILSSSPWLTVSVILGVGWTEFLIIDTRQKLAKININCIRVESTDVCPVTVARTLGSWFDEQLTMSTHFSKLCGAAFYHLHNIKRIRMYLSRESTEMHVHASITSRVDYCNSLLYGLPTPNSLINCRELWTSVSQASL